VNTWFATPMVMIDEHSKLLTINKVMVFPNAIHLFHVPSSIPLLIIIILGQCGI
jgi:hypothetical protein